MGATDVGRAIDAMVDDAVRRRLGERDFLAVEGITLNEEEKNLVQGAALDYPDAVGFGIVVQSWGSNRSLEGLLLNFTKAVVYAQGDSDDPYIVGSNWNGPSK